MQNDVLCERALCLLMVYGIPCTVIIAPIHDDNMPSELISDVQCLSAIIKRFETCLLLVQVDWYFQEALDIAYEVLYKVNVTLRIS